MNFVTKTPATDYVLDEGMSIADHARRLELALITALESLESGDLEKAKQQLMSATDALRAQPLGVESWLDKAWRLPSSFLDKYRGHDLLARPKKISKRP